jgi:hypothetical protein
MRINERSFGGETFLIRRYDSSQCTNMGEIDERIGGPNGEFCDPDETGGLGDQLFGSGVVVAPGVKPQFMDEIVLGSEYEVLEDMRVGIAYSNRRLGRVLEDVSVDNADTYIIANPGEFDTDEEDKLRKERDAFDPMSDEYAELDEKLRAFQGIRLFDKAKRDYDSLTLTVNKRFSRAFFIQAAYTYSRTQGNYPGLFSPDTGQLDPNITSQFDLIELLSNRDGPLPQDRPHYFKVDGYYVFDFKKAGSMTTGVRFRALSGTPNNALGRHYLYGFDEAFLLPRGSRERTGFDQGVDLHLAYGRDLGKGMKIELFTDLFSVFNTQATADISDTYTLDPVNPVVGGEYEDLVFAKAQSTSGGETVDPVTRFRNFGNPTARYSPFSARLGARLTF